MNAPTTSVQATFNKNPDFGCNGNMSMVKLFIGENTIIGDAPTSDLQVVNMPTKSNMKKYLTIFSLIYVCSATNILGQHLNHNLFWFRLILTDRISDRLRWEAYLQSRTQNGIDNKTNVFEANHMRNAWLWLNYKLNDQFRIGISPIGLFQSSIYISRPEDEMVKPVNEYRFSIRLDDENRYSHFIYTNRVGIESRWRDLHSNREYIQNFRFRYMLRLDYPIKKISNQKILFILSAYNETMFQAGVAVKNFPNVFDQNRSYVGIGTNITKSIKTSLGYLFIVQQRLNGRDFDKANTLWFILTFDNVFAGFRNKKAG